MANVFFSYSHKDEALRDELEVHLAMLKREGVIAAWHDRKILAGDELNGQIHARLNDAQVILLLVSPDFLASTYCYDVEVKRAMELHEEGRARVIPVILRPSDWQSSAPFAKLLAAPKDGKPITKWADRDEAWLDVVRQLRAALPKPAQAQPAGAGAGRAQPAVVADGPRSSNLRIRKEYSEADKDGFLDEAFEYMARFFDGSLAELQQRHDGLQTRFKRIDAHTFTAAIYQHGKAVGRCAVVLGGSRGFGGGITYSHDDSARGNSFNESLSVEASDQALFLRPMGMASAWAGEQNGRLTFDGAAEYYWEMLMAPLQR
jgi:hypothetical protein